MNLTDLDSTIQIDAKVCGSLHRRRIAYSVMDFHHSLYINKNKQEGYNFGTNPCM
ncbi:MAG TPA: hypothetical protein VE548_05795 [Nitrososphaeraceae archaeon]|nr:hypothetical protein [Nitrososphaeraceae archaeon]